MIQSSLLAFEETVPKKQDNPHSAPNKEELTVELSPEASDSLRNEEIKQKELSKLKKLRDQYLQIEKKSKNPGEIIFAVKFIESLKPVIERLERGVP